MQGDFLTRMQQDCKKNVHDDDNAESALQMMMIIDMMRLYVVATGLSWLIWWEGN